MCDDAVTPEVIDLRAFSVADTKDRKRTAIIGFDKLALKIHQRLVFGRHLEVRIMYIMSNYRQIAINHNKINDLRC